jgi:hypothetical protein
MTRFTMQVQCQIKPKKDSSILLNFFSHGVRRTDIHVRITVKYGDNSTIHSKVNK